MLWEPGNEKKERSILLVCGKVWRSVCEQAGEDGMYTLEN